MIKSANLPLSCFLFATMCSLAVSVHAEENAPLRHTQKDEPVLFIRATADMQPTGKMLFEPRRLLRAYSADRTRDFPVSDFTLDGRTVTYTGAKPFPSVDASALYPTTKNNHSIEYHADGQRYLLYSPGPYFHNLQVCFDYETDEPADSVYTIPEAVDLPGLHEKIRNGQQITLAVLGDSISKGADASGTMNVQPYAPAYAEQLAEHLRQASGGSVSLYNFSVGGKGSKWAIGQTASVIQRKPDLLIIALGMNDASGRHSMPAQTFADNIRQVINEVKAGSPQTEFLIVSGMLPNPDWNVANLPTHRSYHNSLKQMRSPGIEFCDIQTTWDRITARKGYLSLSGNGVNHPNDFGYRLYADLIAATLIPADKK